jgi:hypothetical protein
MDPFDDPNDCGALWNGLCVGAFNYNTFNNMASHARASFSSFANFLDGGVTLERPHLLGPGSHSADGLHLPDPRYDSGCANNNAMRTTDLDGGFEILGTSFASPAVLGAALRAQQYKGWFSSLAIPQVNKAVLLASTVDANSDGQIGTSVQWSSASDYQDGAGQIDLNLVKQVLDNNRFTYVNLLDSSFVSCGTNCREYTVTTVSVPNNKAIRVALTWNACSAQRSDTAFLNNNLDLALKTPGFCFGVTQQSVAIDSETEMVYNNCNIGAAGNGTYTIKVRIHGGATLNACNGTSYERVGIAWSLQ